MKTILCIGWFSLLYSLLNKQHRGSLRSVISQQSVPAFIKLTAEDLAVEAIFLQVQFAIFPQGCIAAHKLRADGRSAAVFVPDMHACRSGDVTPQLPRQATDGRIYHLTLAGAADS